MFSFFEDPKRVLEKSITSDIGFFGSMIARKRNID
jgi:hypothetical protein